MANCSFKENAATVWSKSESKDVINRQNLTFDEVSQRANTAEALGAKKDKGWSFTPAFPPQIHPLGRLFTGSADDQRTWQVILIWGEVQRMKVTLRPRCMCHSTDGESEVSEVELKSHFYHNMTQFCLHQHPRANQDSMVGQRVTSSSSKYNNFIFQLFKVFISMPFSDEKSPYDASDFTRTQVVKASDVLLWLSSAVDCFVKVGCVSAADGWRQRRGGERKCASHMRGAHILCKDSRPAGQNTCWSFPIAMSLLQTNWTTNPFVKVWHFHQISQGLYTSLQKLWCSADAEMKLLSVVLFIKTAWLMLPAIVHFPLTAQTHICVTFSLQCFCCPAELFTLYIPLYICTLFSNCIWISG